MEDAPRDGLAIVALRKPPRPPYTRKHNIVRIRWSGKCWNNLTSSGNYHDDDGFIGWRPQASGHPDDGRPRRSGSSAAGD